MEIKKNEIDCFVLKVEDPEEVDCIRCNNHIPRKDIKAKNIIVGNQMMIFCNDCESNIKDYIYEYIASFKFSEEEKKKENYREKLLILAYTIKHNISTKDLENILDFVKII